MTELNIVFREDVQTSDPEAVREITESTGFFHDYEIDVAVELVEERLAKGVQSGYHFVFAVLDGKTIAYACYGPTPCTKDSFDFYWMAVLNEFRGKGIGKKLIQYTEDGCRKLGGKKLWLDTSSTDKYIPTRTLYLKCGYVEAACLKDFYDDGDDKVIFLQKL